MAKNTSFLVFLLIMAMGIVAGILGIKAEIAQNKISHLQSATSSLKMCIFECRDTSHGAFKLGLSAAELLVAAHALINLLGGCMCVWSKEELDRATANKQLAVASLILSWIVVGCLLHADHRLFGVAYFMSDSAARKE